MSKVKLTLKIPKTLSDITLGQYQEYMKVLQGLKKGVKEGEELDKGQVEFLNKKALQIFCGIKLEDAYKIPVTAFIVALEQLEKCFAENAPLQKEFTLRDSEGVEQSMGFIPNLETMSFGEYVDLEARILDWSKMHEAMAILYRRKTHISKQLYRIAEYDGQNTLDLYAEVMKKIPVSIAMGSQVFFYRLGMKLAEGTMNYLENHQELSNQFRDNLPNGGVGIRHLLRSQMEMSLNLMRLQRFHSVQP